MFQPDSQPPLRHRLRRRHLPRKGGGLLWDAPTFPLGGRWPAGPDEGADERRITPVGTLISLASLDSFPIPSVAARHLPLIRGVGPLEGGSLFA